MWVSREFQRETHIIKGLDDTRITKLSWKLIFLKIQNQIKKKKVWNRTLPSILFSFLRCNLVRKLFSMVVMLNFEMNFWDIISACSLFWCICPIPSISAAWREQQWELLSSFSLLWVIIFSLCNTNTLGFCLVLLWEANLS